MATKNETAVLAKIQSEIIARKDQINNYAGFKYRTAEGILAEVKPIVNAYNYYIKLSDEIKFIGNSLFLESTAELINDSGAVVLSSKAAALHEEARKGMSPAQLSGATSSYARKYALCGLFGIDDAEQDIDANATHEVNARPVQKMQQSQIIGLNAAQIQNLKALIAKTNTDEARFLAAYKCDCLEHFNLANYDDAVGKLNAKDAKNQLKGE